MLKNEGDLTRKSLYEKCCKNVIVCNYGPFNLITHKKNREQVINHIKQLINSNNYDYVYSISGLLVSFIFKKIKQANMHIKTIFYSLGPGAIRRKGKNLLLNLLFKIKFENSIKYMDYIFYISNKCVSRAMLKSGHCFELIDYPEVEVNITKASHQKNVLGILATISKNKNQIFCIRLIEFLNKFDNFKLIIMGNIIEMDYYQKIVKYINNHNLQNIIEFLPGDSDKRAFFEQIDLLLLPSKREGLPLVLLESQYLGIGCISSRVVPESADLGGLYRLKTSITKWSSFILHNKIGDFVISADLKQRFCYTLKNQFGSINEN